MKAYLYPLSLAYFIVLLLFFVFIPLRAFGLYEYVLFYPAQGETQAAKNFFRIFFVIPPILVFIGSVLSILSYSHFTHFFSSPKLRRSLLVASISATVGAGLIVFTKVSDGRQVLIFLPPVFLIYFLIEWGLIWVSTLKIKNPK